MVNFRLQHRPGRNYLARGEQRRLLTMVALLGLVFFLMQRAKDPRTWQWMFVLTNQPQSGDLTDISAPRPQGNDSRAYEAESSVDTELPPKIAGDAVPGHFTAPLDEPVQSLPPRRHFPGVRPELLLAIKDDTVFRGAEHHAFYHLLRILRENDEETLNGASTGTPAFVQLFRQSPQYRGELVTLSGTVKQALSFPSSKNDYGVEKFHRVVLQLPDNPSAPVIAYLLELPAGFPTGERLNEEARLTGFFFKRWAYVAGDGIRSSPLLLAKTLTWQPNAPAAATELDVSPPTVTLALTISLLIGAAVMYVARAKPAMSRSGPTRASSRGHRDPLPALRKLENLTVEPAAVEALGKLSDQVPVKEAPPSITISRGS